MGLIGAFFAKNKFILLIAGAILAIQATVMVAGGIVGASSFMDALSGNDADSDQCAQDYKSVVNGIFGNNADALAELLEGCPVEEETCTDTAQWLQIIAAAQERLGKAYDEDEVNRLEALAEQAGNCGTDYAVGDGNYMQPVMGPLTSGFGPRGQIVPGVRTLSFHYGQDIAVPTGTTVQAAHDGTVIDSRYFGTYGNWVLIDTGNGIDIGTAHATKNLVKVGEKVTKGQPIQISGMTGAATGPHVHVEVRIKDVKVDPVPFFKSKGAPLGPGKAAAVTNPLTPTSPGGSVNNIATNFTVNQDVHDDFEKLKKDHHDKTIWQAIIDYASAKVNGTTYDKTLSDALVKAAADHVGDKYVASRSGWNADSQNYCAKSPKSVDGAEVRQCGFDDASLTGYAVSKTLDLSLKGGISVKPWDGSVAAEENYLVGQKHGVVVDLATIMPGDLVFISYGSNLADADHVVIYAGTVVRDGDQVKRWIEAVDDDHDIQYVYGNQPDFLQGYDYEVVRPYHAASADGTAPVTGTGAVADAKRYAQERIAAHSSWGWSVAADWPALEKMWTRESSWNLTAENDACHTASPAAPEYQAYGIAQMCPGAKMANTAAGGGADWKTNYKTQVESGLYYIHSRYGSPHAAWAKWQQQGWY